MSTSAALITLAVLSAGSLAGCTSVPAASVTTLEAGDFKTVVRGETAHVALNSAANSARDTCRALARQHTVTASQTRSLGLPGRTGDPDRQAEELARYASAVSFPSLAATDDFEATMQFNCSRPPAPAAASAPASAAAL
jgi:hypothetical protein